MKKKLDAILATPWIAHLVRAWTRFGNRLGNQFAAAITYFSVLALVPLLMFAFATLGMVVTTLHPEMLDSITRRLDTELGAVGAGGKVTGLIKDYLVNWRGVGIVGLLSLVYAGSGWVGNLRSAINAQWRPEFEHQEDQKNVVIQTLANVGVLFVLLIGVFGTMAVTVMGQTMNDTLARWLDVAHWPGGHLLLRLMAFLLTVAASWLLFLLLFWILPQEHRVTRVTMVGALIGAVFFALLQLGAGTLVGAFRSNKAASLFGPVIVLMLVMNLFARGVLLVATWIATTHQPAVAFHHNACDDPLRDDPLAETAPDHWRLADEEREERSGSSVTSDRRTDERPAPEPVLPRDAGRYRPKIVTLEEYPHPDPSRSVSEPVAARSVKVGMASGWAVGIGTGLGLGALVASGLNKVRRR